MQSNNSLFPEVSNSFSLNLKQWKERSGHDKKHLTLYTQKKKTVLTYKTIFIGFALLFAFMSFAITFFSPNWTANSLIINWQLVRYCFGGFSGILSGLAFTIGLSIKVEKEIINQMIKQSKRKLLLTYNRIQPGFRINSWLPFIQNHIQSSHLLINYYEKLELLNYIKEEYLSLIQSIASTSTISKTQKENLFNQALVELNNKTNHLIASI